MYVSIDWQMSTNVIPIRVRTEVSVLTGVSTTSVSAQIDSLASTVSLVSCDLISDLIRRTVSDEGVK